jgi:hypothetical protein
VSIDQVTEAFAKIAEDFKVKPMQGAALESISYHWALVLVMAAKVEK